MIGWLFASPADRRLLGVKPLSGPTPWLIAIMSFSMVLVGAAGLALANTASLFSTAVESRFAVELPAGRADLARLTEAVRSAPGVRSVEPVPETEMRATLRRWLGPAADSGDLPIPALIEFTLEPGASLVEVRQKIARVAPDATVEAHRATVQPILRSLRTLQWIALALVTLLAAAAASAVVLAARGALDTHRATIDVLHGIGATDAQVTDLFQRRIALDALAGSVAGALAAALVLLLLAAGSAFLGEMTGGVTLGWRDLVLLLLLLPFALTVLATAVARAAVLARLRRSP